METTAKDEVEILDAIHALSECGINETESIDESYVFDQLLKVRNSLSDPTDLDKFMQKHYIEIQKIQSELPSEKKSVLLKAWECLTYAVKKGFAFIKAHWKKILIAALIVAALLFFTVPSIQSNAISFGNSLFGKSNIYQKAKGAAKAITSKIQPLIPFGAKGAVDWIPVDASDVDDVAVGADNGSWVGTLKSTGQRVYGMLSDPDDEDSIHWFKPKER